MSLSTIILIALAIVVVYVMFRAARAGRDQTHARGVDGDVPLGSNDPAAPARRHSGHGRGEEGGRRGHGCC